jgi:branched-chain amino acid transport system permease protein
MDFDISVLIAQDGITSGAIYAMMALGMVLVFNATRIIFVPFGDLAAYAALTLGYFQLHQRPGTIWFVAILAVAAWGLEVIALVRRGAAHRFWRAWFLSCPWGLLSSARMSIYRPSFTSSLAFCWCCRSARCSIAWSTSRLRTLRSSFC